MNTLMVVWCLVTVLAFQGVLAQESWTAGCNVTKSCFTSPEGCLDTSNCLAIVIVEENDGVFTFEMESVGGVYVAVGLSDDAIMGNDSVVECVHDVDSPTGQVNLFVSFNSGKSNNRIPSGPAANGVNLLESSFLDGAVHCSFTREAVTVIANNVYDLVSNQYHLLLAAGTQIITNPAAAGLAYHDVTHVPSSEARFLSEVGWFSVSST